MPGPRTVTISVSQDREEYRPLGHTRVPAILHVCHTSRILAQNILQPLFATDTSGIMLNAYTFFDLSIDTLRLSLEDAQRIAMCQVPEHIRWARDRTRHVEIVFHFTPRLKMCKAIADLVLLSTHRSWPSIRTWSLPNAPKAGEPEASRKEIVKLIVKRPLIPAEADDEETKDFASRIKEALNQARMDFGEGTQVGISISYN